MKGQILVSFNYIQRIQVYNCTSVASRFIETDLQQSHERRYCGCWRLVHRIYSCEKNQVDEAVNLEHRSIKFKILITRLLIKCVINICLQLLACVNDLQ